MVATNQLVEIRWHGRGGQGAVTSAELVAQAAIHEGKFAQAFPSFGPERRGAPVLSFVRVDASQPIRVRTEIREPDVVVILDPSLLRIMKVTTGLKGDGLVVVNSRKTPEELKQEFGITQPVFVVNATKIAREILGVNITNTTMVGALVKATEIVKLDAMVGPLQHRFGRLAERNLAAMKRAYEETTAYSKEGVGVRD